MLDLRQAFTCGMALVFLSVSACSTVTEQTPSPVTGMPEPKPATEPVPAPEPTPELAPETPSGPEPAPNPAPEPPPPEVEVFEELSAFQSLTYWQEADTRAALTAFQRSCALWAKRDQERWLNANLPEYGQYQDWGNACFASDYVAGDAASARRYFENYFQPVTITTSQDTRGLLTGYYEPEISVRATPDAIYSEPILSLPSDPARQALPRNQITSATAPVMAWGKPIDVFFMQVQGSGRLAFPDGRRQRAAFAGHNSKRYTSIGRVLVNRGEMTVEQASKQSIEAWMNSHGADQARALMNENARYVFFKAEILNPGEGPKGSMGIPLVAMGSLAVDARYHPYGSLVFLRATLPQYGGDYKGQETGILLTAQDSGGAIKGPLRGDLFFGSGAAAGELAGVQKHQVSWTVLLPNALAMRYLASL